MPVHLPTAALGNSQVLVTLGASAEVMSLFYPDLDHSQNVYEWMTAVYAGPPGEGRLSWTWDELWEREQEYVPDTNVVVTRLRSSALGLVLTITDFVDDELDAFHRRFELRNTGSGQFTGALLQYLELRLGEVPRKQSVRYLDQYHGFLQYYRGLAIAVGGDPPDEARCGKSPRHPSGGTKADLGDGRLESQSEDIGDVAIALSWRAGLAPGESMVRELHAVAADGEPQALRGLEAAQADGFDRRRERAENRAQAWLGRARQVELADDLQGAYRRSLLAARLLASRRSGAIIAAPEFDPAFELSGGYGFCWPRDGCEGATALAAAGYPEVIDHWCEWLIRTQGEDGLWRQRYWSSGQAAPAWCQREGFEQVDQGAAATLCLAEQARERGAEDWWEPVRRAAEALSQFIGDDGLHKEAADLWEIHRGTFVYTNSGIAAALRAAADLAEQQGETDLASSWRHVAARIKAAVLRDFWQDDHFIRGKWPGGDPDWTPDSSTLGTIVPFRLVTGESPDERELIGRHLAWVEQNLGREHNGGRGIVRFTDEAYLGGTIGAVNTLWMAEAMLALAVWGRAPRAAGLADAAERYMRFALRHGTPTGLLPELIGAGSGPAYWAAPHAWSSGLFIRCALALSALRARLGGKASEA
jgi:oligosaccharide amylase